jgi:NAD(P)-dependent dehydrogenase (short-subunit alcohol dehydrogenase family)
MLLPSVIIAEAARGVARMADKVSVITGAGSGVGRACALALIDDGWSVVLVGRRETALKETAELAGDAAERAVPIATDITNADAVARLFTAVGERFGRVDMLFNNAANTMGYIPTEDVAVEDWSRVLNSIATGTFLCAQAAYRMMKDQSPRGGRIINNGAPSAHVPRPDSIAFTAAKHAVTGLTRSLSLDGRQYDIACGQIDIGNVTPVGRAQPAVKQANGTFVVEPTMDVRHVADTVIAMANLPLTVNVQFVTVMPSAMPYIGRG